MITESLGIDGNVFSSVIVTTIPSGWKCYCSMIFRIQHRSGRKHVNVDSLSRIPSEPEVCECYEGHLTLEEPSCKGCDTCLRKHKQWSDFSQFDDAVPLFAKRNVQISGSSKARVSRVKLHESGFWSWIFLLLQLQVVKLLNCVRFMYRGLLRIRKYRR